MKITGIMIYYYIVCKRKLYYYLNEIKLESGNQDVQIGKIIDETLLTRKEEHHD